MLISKQELCESLSRMSPRTFAYMNELDYPNLYLELERYGIKLPSAKQLQKALQYPQYQPSNQSDNNHLIKLKEEPQNIIDNEKLRFLQFYSSNQQSEMLDAYLRMTKLKIKENMQPLKLTYPIDSDTLTQLLNLPPLNENKDASILLYTLQKLLSELKTCNIKFSIYNHIIEIIYPHHIVKIFFNLYKSNKSIFPLQIFISSHCRMAPFIEEIKSISISTTKELPDSMVKLFLLILKLPEALTRQEFSVSQRNYELAEKIFNQR